MLEHPAYTELHDTRGNRDALPPSIWKLDELSIFNAVPGAFFHTFDQGRLGQISKKPTTVLVLGLQSLPQRLAAFETAAPVDWQPLCGKSNGKFATFSAKEWPSDMCHGIALAISDRWLQPPPHCNAVSSSRGSAAFLEFATALVDTDIDHSLQPGPDYAPVGR